MQQSHQYLRLPLAVMSLFMLTVFAASWLHADESGGAVPMCQTCVFTQTESFCEDNAIPSDENSFSNCSALGSGAGCMIDYENMDCPSGCAGDECQQHDDALRIGLRYLSSDGSIVLVGYQPTASGEVRRDCRGFIIGRASREVDRPERAGIFVV